MQFLNHHGGDFLIAHFQGDSGGQHYPAVMTFTTAQIELPPEITVMTFVSRFEQGPMMLIEQLDHAGIAYLNPAKDVAIWQNPMKIELILDAIRGIETPYLLILDARDVLLVQSLRSIFERFALTNKRVLFGATKSNHPPVTIDKLRDRDWLGEFKYLNAGTTFGRTEDVAVFYARAAEVKKRVDNPWASEQFIVRHAFAEDTDTVGFDHQCSIFQTFGRVDVEQNGEVVTIT